MLCCRDKCRLKVPSSQMRDIFMHLQQLHSSLVDVQKGLIEKLPGDLLALDIRRCLHYLGEITGEITNEDQLDYIFSKFCIGK